MLKHLLKTTPFKEFTDPTWEDRIPLVGMPLSVILELGIYHGRVFLRCMREQLQAKNVHTFADLVHPDYADDPKYRYKRQVVVSDVTMC